MSRLEQINILTFVLIFIWIIACLLRWRFGKHLPPTASLIGLPIIIALPVIAVFQLNRIYELNDATAESLKKSSFHNSFVNPPICSRDSRIRITLENITSLRGECWVEHISLSDIRVNKNSISSSIADLPILAFKYTKSAPDYKVKDSSSESGVWFETQIPNNEMFENSEITFKAECRYSYPARVGTHQYDTKFGNIDKLLTIKLSSHSEATAGSQAISRFSGWENFYIGVIASFLFLLMPVELGLWDIKGLK